MAGFVTNIAKKIAFWTYPRTSWQWDVLCVLILVFIFLTPKSWFENSEYQHPHLVQNTILVSTDVVGSQLDRPEIERRAKVQANRAGAQVREVRPRTDPAGRLVAYEVDIQ
jgi:hypothetical protein